MLSKAQHEAVRAAVAAAEARTSGEILCVVARQSAHYGEVPFGWASAIALAAPPLALAFGVRPGVLLAAFQNDWIAAHTAAIDQAMTAALIGYAALQAALFVVVAAIASLPAVKLALTPAALKRAEVHKRAMEQFFARGIPALEDRAGVLIYVSSAERRVEVIAGEGIHGKVGEAVWNEAVDAALQRIRRGDAAGGLIAAVEICGAALAEHFPPDAVSVNRLPDDVTEI
jgi:putative membrane protein